jgi:hypothetical protein
VFEGISVDEAGKQHFLDVSIAYKRAVLNCIDYLSKVAGYTKEQVRLRPSRICPRLCFDTEVLFIPGEFDCEEGLSSHCESSAA